MIFNHLRLTGLICLILFQYFPLAAQTIINRPGLDDCELTFEDNFDGTAINTNVWHYRTDSKHWSTHLPENVEVKDSFYI